MCPRGRVVHKSDRAFRVGFGFGPGSGLYFRVRAGFGPKLVGPFTTLPRGQGRPRGSTSANNAILELRHVNMCF